MKFDTPGPKLGRRDAGSRQTIALLGQPNAGKSTLFNALTGSRQHVGNWPGKTVEQKTGIFSRNGSRFSVVDLPGSYSLNAVSQEEAITREFVASGAAGRVCILVDASQLERSLFMLADFMGIDCPVVLVLNMMDVAAEKGIDVDAEWISQTLGIPVAAMCAADKSDYDGFFAALAAPPACLDPSALERRYEADLGDDYSRLRDLIPAPRIGVYSRAWLVSKMMEKDRPAMDLVRGAVSPDVWQRIEAILGALPDGALRTGASKFAWIKDLLRQTAPSSARTRPPMGRFDRLATSRRWGKPLAFSMMIAGLMASFVITIPWMMLSWKVPRLLLPVVLDALAVLHAGPWLLSLIDVALKAVGTAVGMAGFVGGSALVFGFFGGRWLYGAHRLRVRQRHVPAGTPGQVRDADPYELRVPHRRRHQRPGHRLLGTAGSHHRPGLDRPLRRHLGGWWPSSAPRSSAFRRSGCLRPSLLAPFFILFLTAKLFSPGLLKGEAPGGPHHGTPPLPSSQMEQPLPVRIRPHG